MGKTSRPWNLDSPLAVPQTLGPLAHPPALWTVGLWGGLHPSGITSKRWHPLPGAPVRLRVNGSHQGSISDSGRGSGLSSRDLFCVLLFPDEVDYQPGIESRVGIVHVSSRIG